MKRLTFISLLVVALLWTSAFAVATVLAPEAQVPVAEETEIHFTMAMQITYQHPPTTLAGQIYGETQDNAVQYQFAEVLRSSRSAIRDASWTTFVLNSNEGSEESYLVNTDEMRKITGNQACWVFMAADQSLFPRFDDHIAKILEGKETQFTVAEKCDIRGPTSHALTAVTGIREPVAVVELTAETSENDAIKALARIDAVLHQQTGTQEAATMTMKCLRRDTEQIDQVSRVEDAVEVQMAMTMTGSWTSGPAPPEFQSVEETSLEADHFSVYLL